MMEGRGGEILVFYFISNSIFGFRYELLRGFSVFSLLISGFVTWQIGSSPHFYSMSVRNLIEFTSHIHFSNPH